jgi:hypothetical protein
MPRNAQARMCWREVIQLHKVTIPIHTNPYQNPYQSITHSSEILCSIELSKGLERTGSNHVFYRLGNPEGEPAKARLPQAWKSSGRAGRNAATQPRES